MLDGHCTGTALGTAYVNERRRPPNSCLTRSPVMAATVAYHVKSEGFVEHSLQQVRRLLLATDCLDLLPLPDGLTFSHTLMVALMMYGM